MSHKVDAGFVQDQWHYAMAMQRSGESTFACDTILQRLEAARSAQRAIDALRIEHGNPADWDNVRPRVSLYETMEDFVNGGKLLQFQCEKWGRENNIDPRTGEKP